jgi:hypothetical protein
MAYPRISGRRGHEVDLNVTFYNNGVPTDPYAIYKVEIYKTKYTPGNLIASIPVISVDNPLYPAPVEREYIATETGDCGTAPVTSIEPVTGKFHYYYDVPNTVSVPDTFIDVWYYYPNDPCTNDGTSEVTGGCDLTLHESELLKCCKRFIVFPDEWLCDDGLQTVNFSFNPLNLHFHYPEVKPLEISLMPLPLYEYNYNLVAPMIPYLQPSITIKTQHNELLIDNAEMTIGLAQGYYRTNPWVLRYNLDTSLFLKGTYEYSIKLVIPDGTTRVSRKFMFTIS